MADAEQAEIERLRKTVFFVSPIGEDGSDERNRSDELMQWVLRPAVAAIDSELEVVRADVGMPIGDISDNVIIHLLYSRAIVVDTTGRNPNVYYELGIAHARHRPVVLIIDDVSKIPFDLSHQAHLPIPGVGNIRLSDVTTAKPKLERMLKQAIGQTIQRGPVATAERYLSIPTIGRDELGRPPTETAEVSATTDLSGVTPSGARPTDRQITSPANDRREFAEPVVMMSSLERQLADAVSSALTILGGDEGFTVETVAISEGNIVAVVAIESPQGESQQEVWEISCERPAQWFIDVKDDTVFSPAEEKIFNLLLDEMTVLGLRYSDVAARFKSE